LAFVRHKIIVTYLHNKLTGLQLVKKFPAFQVTRRIITALTSVRERASILRYKYTAWHSKLSWCYANAHQYYAI